MARFRLNYLLLILISFLLSLVYSRLSSVLFISLVILSVLSFIVLIINYFLLVLIFQIKLHNKQGQEQKIIIEIKNKGFMPLLPLEIIGELPVSTDGLKKGKLHHHSSF